MRLSDKFDLKLYSQTPYFSRSELYRELGLSINTFAVCENQIFTAHWHDFYELELIVDGNATHMVNNREYQLKRGDIHLITQADFHQLHITSPTATIFNLAFLPASLSPALMENILPLSFSSVSLSDEQFDELFIELKFLLNQYDNIDFLPNTMLLKNAFERVLLLFISYVFPNGVPKSSEKRIRPLQKALTYMRENYSHTITLDEVAKAADFESTYFCRYFSKNMGVSFTDYLNRLRCSIAAVFLSGSENPIEQIAYDVGYTSASYFSKTFRRIYGISPVVYRQSKRAL